MLRNSIQAVLVTIAACLAGEISSACILPSVPVQSSYESELKACVDNSHSKEESQECRSRVDKKYDVCKNVSCDYYGPCSKECK